MELKDITKEAITINQTASFRDAVAMMIGRQTNSLLVVDDEGILVGELSISRLLRTVVPDYIDNDTITAHFVSNEMFEEAVHDTAEKEIQYFMSTDIHTVKENESLAAVATHAIAKHKIRVAVVDVENKPLGVISRRGLKHIIGSALGISDSE